MDRKTLFRNITQQFLNQQGIAEMYGIDPEIAFEDQFSLVSIEGQLFDIFSQQLSLHLQMVQDNALVSRPQSIPNLKQSVLNYLDGLSLTWIDGRFDYNTAGITDLAARKIIDACSILESGDGELVIKVAHDNNGDLEPITPEQQSRLLFYIDQIKVPGVRIRCINKPADLLNVSLNVYVDPLLFNLATGQRLSDLTFPIQDAVDEFERELEFNGAFVANFFCQKLQSIQGVYLAAPTAISHSFDNNPPQLVSSFVIPESGYFSINLNPTYLPYELVNG